MVLLWFIHAYIPRSIKTLSHPHLQSQTTRNHSKKMRNPSAPAASSNNNNSSIRTPCCTKVGLKRGPWTPEEDELLSTYITREGEGRWRTLPKRAGLLRCGKSCRLRWMNYLRPSVKRGHIAPDEEDLILRLHRLLGNRWSLIAGRIPGRTDNEIKNYWNTHLSKKLISQGIDPRTHKPLSQSDLRQLAPASNPNPNPNLEKDDGGGDDQHGHVQSYCSEESSMGKPQGGTTNFDDEERDHRIDDARIDHDGSGMMMMMMGFEGGHGSMKQGDDMDCCSDDIFSSFLNSLINDEVFVQQQQQQQHQQQQQQQGSGEGLVSVPGFGYGPFWDSTISSAPGVNGEEHGLGFVENESKRF